MRVIVEFDLGQDLIEVPDELIPRLMSLRNRFLDWLYNPAVKHSYRETYRDSSGRKIVGMSYRAEAFVEWLNKKELKKAEEKAVLLAQYAHIEDNSLPKIFF